MSDIHDIYYSTIFYGDRGQLNDFVSWLVHRCSIDFYAFIFHKAVNSDECDHFHILVRASSSFVPFIFSDRCCNWARVSFEHVCFWLLHSLKSPAFYRFNDLPLPSVTYTLDDIVCSDSDFWSVNFSSVLKSFKVL